MKREDFVFSVGYDGDTAIVDSKARKRHGKLTTEQLAAEGLYKAAFCSALYSGNQEEIRSVIDAYNAGEGTTYSTADDLKRMFGVYEVPSDIQKVKTL